MGGAAEQLKSIKATFFSLGVRLLFCMQAQFSQYGLLSILMLPLGLGLGTAAQYGVSSTRASVCMLMAAETSSTFFFSLNRFIQRKPKQCKCQLI